MGDGDRRRRGQALRMLAHQHRRAFVLAEPARVRRARCASMVMSSFSASAWQPIISDIGNGHGCEERYVTRPHLTPASSSVSRRTASSIASPGSTKPARHDHMRRGEAAGAAEQAAVAAHREHDDDRIGAREMLGLAGRAGALPAGLDQVGGGAAVRAEAVARMPVQHRLGLGDRRQVLGRDQALDRDRAQVDDEEIVARLQRFGARRRDADAEARRAVEQAEEHRLGDRGQRARLVGREQRIVRPLPALSTISSPPIT